MTFFAKLMMCSIGQIQSEKLVELYKPFMD
jgi:hypothetical protein